MPNQIQLQDLNLIVNMKVTVTVEVAALVERYSVKHYDCDE